LLIGKNKPYPIVNQDGQVLNPISDQKQLKTMAFVEAHRKAKDNILHILARCLHDQQGQVSKVTAGMHQLVNVKFFTTE